MNNEYVNGRGPRQQRYETGKKLFYGLLNGNKAEKWLAPRQKNPNYYEGFDVSKLREAYANGEISLDDYNAALEHATDAYKVERSKYGESFDPTQRERIEITKDAVNNPEIDPYYKREFYNGIDTPYGESFVLPDGKFYQAEKQE